MLKAEPLFLVNSLMVIELAVNVSAPCPNSRIKNNAVNNNIVEWVMENSKMDKEKIMALK